MLMSGQIVVINSNKKDTLILIVVLLILLGLCIAVVRFADEIDGVKHSEVRR